MLLIPIGFGILIGNIPFNMDAGLKVGIYEEGSVLNILYQGVTSGWYPPLIFLGIGAMTDFSALISNPKLMLIGAAAQFGIFGAYMIALEMGFDPMQAGAIGIIGTDNREYYFLCVRNSTRRFHADYAFVFCGEQTHDRRLYHRDQRHIGIGRHRNSSH